MKTKSLRTFLFLAFVLAIGMNARADNSEYCKRVIANSGDPENTKAYLTWITNESGEIVITISEYGENGNTAFRADGMKPLSGFKLNEEPLSDYFTQSYSGDGGKTMTFTPKSGVNIPEGAVVTFGGGGNFIEWKTSKDGNCYRECTDDYIFSYTYGTACDQLETPVITNVAEDGIISFNPVANADRYKVYVFKDDKEAYSQFITQSGDKIDFISYGANNYIVKLQALSSGSELDSKLSEGKDWTPVAVELGVSEYCSEKLGNSPVYLTWITNAFGEVEITISGDPGIIATFRGGEGMNKDGFKYNGEPMTNYFVKTSADKSNIITLTPIKGAGVAKGGIITFNKNNEQKQIEWYENGGGKNSNAYSFEYTYATTCPVLAVPVIDNIATDGTITFAPVENALSYKVHVYKRGAEVYSQTIASGEKINFVSYIDYTYEVKLQAVADPQTIYMDSDLSAGANWTPAKGELALSEYCHEQIGNNANNYVDLTWVTDGNGNVVITISGQGDTEASFRGGQGMNVAGFKIYGESITEYFDKVYAGDKTKTITLVPKTGVTIDPGDKITFNKYGEGQQIEWFAGTTSANGNNYSFEYSYGTNCGEIGVPAISSIATDGTITFSPVANATSYKVYVYRGTFMVYSQDIVSGQKIDFVPNVTYDYEVKLQAANDKVESELSEPYTWSLTAGSVTIGPSEYCDYQFANGSESTYANLSWRTNAAGEIIISISGYNNDQNTAFRANAINASGFTIYGEPLSDYFDRTHETGSTTVVYTPKADAEVYPGDKIKFAGLIEWKTTTQNPSGNYTFEYTYGSTCSQLETPKVTNIADDGTMTYTAIDNAASYMVYIYRDMFLVGTQSVTYGEKINFVPNISYTYEVVVKAISADDTYMDSELSEPCYWNLTAPSLVLDKSEYCDFLIGPNEKQYANLSLITDEQGNIVISISGYDGDEGTAFRTNAISIDNFRVYGFPLKDYFTLEEYQEGSTAIILKPKDDNTIVPGDKIIFNGNIGWKTSQEGNAWGNYSLEYTYGTNCSDAPEKTPLETPVILDIAKDGTITFEPVDNADSYTVFVHDEDEDMIHSQQIVSGEKIVSASIGNYVYSVMLQAFPADEDENHLESKVSEAYQWDLRVVEKVKLATPVISSITEEGIITFTAVPNADSYGVYVYKGTDEVYTQTIHASGEKINFVSSESYVYLVKLQAFPADGDEVYSESDLSEGYKWDLTEEEVEKLATPVISSITEDGIITFAPVANAGSYTVYVYKGKEEAYTQVINASGEKINFTSSVDYTYTVKLQAFPASGDEKHSESDMSEGFSWELKGPGSSTLISDISKENVIVYPNPATDVLYLSVKMKEASLYSLYGQLVSSYQDVEKINVSGLPKGMYVLLLVGESGKETAYKIEVR